MNEDQYYYCVVHKKALLVEDVQDHREESCEFILEEFQWHHRNKRKVQWLPANVVDKYGMHIYHPKKKATQRINTLPKNAKIYEPERRQIGSL